METADKTSSVLFAGVAGNVRLQEKLGSAEALRAADRCLKRVERAIEAFGGHVVRSEHNECLALFQGADNALRAAVEMQHRVADLPPVSGIKLAVRVGFYCGPVGGTESEPTGDAVAIAAQLAGFAEPGQILTADQGVARLSPEMQTSARRIKAPAIKGQLSASVLYEIVLPHHGEHLPTSAGMAQIAHASLDSAEPERRLRVSHAGKDIVLDEKQTAITIGRGQECDIHVGDRRASRNHARIDYKNGCFVLTDASTNGTFVTANGEPEIRVRQRDCVLHGKGILCFASPLRSEGAESAEFELLPVA